MMNRILVVGATGELGRRIVGGLCDAGESVRVLARAGRGVELISEFEARGVEVVEGDLRNPDSLRAACKDVGTVVSTASSMGSQVPGDTIETVDRRGHLDLIQAAEDEKVSHFVFVSFADIDVEFDLMRAKKDVEQRLARSPSLSYAILKPTYFMETWLAALIPGPNEASITVFGEGTSPVSWISRDDVTRYAIVAATKASGRKLTVSLGGPEALSQREAIGIFEGLGVAKSEVAAVPSEQFEMGRQQAPEPRAEAFASLILGIARGLVVDPARGSELASFGLSTVRDFGVRYLERHATRP